MNLTLAHSAARGLGKRQELNWELTCSLSIQILIMNKVKSESKDKLVEASDSYSCNHDSFNFELWAKKVKPQLLATLQKNSEKQQGNRKKSGL